MKPAVPQPVAPRRHPADDPVLAPAWARLCDAWLAAAVDAAQHAATGQSALPPPPPQGARAGRG